MSQYYPQGAVSLKILFEDFSDTLYGPPQIILGTKELIVVPRKLTVNLNNYKTACTFDMELEYKNFPFDPRCIKACGVTIHLEDMESLYKNDGITRNLLTPTEGNAILTGFVDEESINFNDMDRIVHFEGRDQTALLIDQKYTQITTPVLVNVLPVIPTSESIVPINQNLPVDQAIERFLATFPALIKIKVKSLVVDANGASVVLPTLGSYHPDFGTNELAGHKNVTQHSSYWDIIQDAVAAAGLIAYMRLDTIYISNARTLYSPSKAIKMIYGYNIKTLEYKRKLGRHKGFNVAVRSFNSKTKTAITARIPYDASQDWCRAIGLPFKTEITVPKLNPDGTLADDTGQPAPYIALQIANISDQDALTAMGQNVFEELIRQDIEGNLETHEMVIHTGDIKTDNENHDEYSIIPNYDTPELVNVDIGTPISIDIYQTDLIGIQRLGDNVAAKTRYLKARGYPDVIANLFAQTLDKTAPVFYIKSVQHNLDSDGAYSCKISFINYLDIKNKNITGG